MNKNNSPAQKAAWKALRGTGRLMSRFGNITPSTCYAPQHKMPSRRDQWRADVAQRREERLIKSRCQ